MRDKIRQLILNSKLSLVEKGRILDFMNYQDEKELLDYYEVIKKESNLQYFSRSLMTKIQAKQINDASLWNKLLLEDEAYIKGVN